MLCVFFFIWSQTKWVSNIKSIIPSHLNLIFPYFIHLQYFLLLLYGESIRIPVHTHTCTKFTCSTDAFDDDFYFATKIICNDCCSKRIAAIALIGMQNKEMCAIRWLSYHKNLLLMFLVEFSELSSFSWFELHQRRKFILDYGHSGVGDHWPIDNRLFLHVHGYKNCLKNDMNI